VTLTTPKAAKIKDLHFHDLRRTFASRLSEKGAGLGDVADLLGHGATYVTERYRWMSSDHLRNVMGKLSGTPESEQPSKKQGRQQADGLSIERATGT